MSSLSILCQEEYWRCRGLDKDKKLAMDDGDTRDDSEEKTQNDSDTERDE